MDLIQELHNIGEAYMDEAYYTLNSVNKFFDNNGSEVKSGHIVNVWSFELTGVLDEEYNLDGSVQLKNSNGFYVTRASEGAAAKGNLFPINDLINVSKKNTLFKGIKKAIANTKEIYKLCDKDEAIEAILDEIDKVDFEKLEKAISDNEMAMSVKKIDGVTIKSYFTFTYKGKFITSYMDVLYIKHINRFFEKEPNSKKIETTCFLTNSKKINATVDTPFSSTNELAPNMQEREKILNFSLSPLEAGIVNYGYKNLLNKFSFYWGGIQVALIPTLLNSSKEQRNEIYRYLEEEIAKNKLESVKEMEYALSEYIEDFVTTCSNKNFTVLNSFLFYEQSNSKNDLLLQIDDVLPSYISKISDVLKSEDVDIRLTPKKGEKNKFYLQNLFDKKLDMFNLILSNQVLSKNEFLTKINKLIMTGGYNQQNNIKWDGYFNQMYSNGTGRQIEHLARVSNLFYRLKKIDFQILKDNIMDELKKDEQKMELSKEEFLEKIKEYEENVILINDEKVLKIAFYTGMLSALLINYQKANTNGNSSLASYLSFRNIRTFKDLMGINTKINNLVKKYSSYKHIGRKTENIVSILLELFATVKETKANCDAISICFAIGGENAKLLKKFDIKG